MSNGDGFTTARSIAAVRRSRIAAIIPAYNEERHITEVVNRTLEQLDNVLVVDDGSSDQTSLRARTAGAQVIVHDRNQGKGASIQSGLRHWMNRDFDYILILDADGQHSPEEIDAFIAAASASSAELLVGTRMADTKQMPFVRRVVNRYMSRRISKLCGQEVPDTQCGFRMVRSDTIPDLLIDSSRFDYETEMLIVASWRGFRIDSVPITTIYADEVSSINPWTDTFRFFRLIKKYEKLRAEANVRTAAG